jgi:hypothetical protein
MEDDDDGLVDRGAAGSGSIQTTPRQVGLSQAVCAELARRLRSRKADLLEAVLAHVRSVVLDSVPFAEERLEPGLRETMAACIDCSLAILEGAELGGSREQRRAEIAHKLLAGEQVDTRQLAELGYEIDAWHLAFVAMGPDSERAVRRLQAGLGRQLLCVAYGEQTVLAWLGGQRRPAYADIERLLSGREYADACLAVGEPAQGLDGWRQTHREAKRTALVARCRPRRLTRYRDVALEAVALEDRTLAASLIGTYLSPLGDGRGGGLIRRRVLRALFEAEYNKSSAAHALRVDRETVHRHVKEIERRLGRRLHERRVEIEMALRLDELLGFERSRSRRLDEPSLDEMDAPVASERG